MPTRANVWEIDGREMAPPQEMDTGIRDSLNLGAVGQGHGQVEEVKQGITVGGNGGYQAYRPPGEEGVVRPPGEENGNSNWSKRNVEGEFLGSRPVGQAM
jgi:hypothetical protein